MTPRKFDGEWMPRFGDWWFESERVDALSDGAYRLYDWLLWRQWKHESIPADPSSIVPARFARRWKALWAEVSPFFDLGPDGRLRNETCALVRDDAEERRGKARTRGRNGAAVTNAKRWGERRSECRSSDEQANATESLAGRTVPYRTVPNRTEETHPNPPVGRDPEPNPRPERAPKPDPVDPATCPLPPSLDRPDVRAELAAWVARRREEKHPPLGPVGLARVVNQLEPRGPDFATHALGMAADRGGAASGPSGSTPRTPSPRRA